jgi:hypothetical protein
MTRLRLLEWTAIFSARRRDSRGRRTDGRTLEDRRDNA